DPRCFAPRLRVELGLVGELGTRHPLCAVRLLWLLQCLLPSRGDSRPGARYPASHNVFRHLRRCVVRSDECCFPERPSLAGGSEEQVHCVTVYRKAAWSGRGPPYDRAPAVDCVLFCLLATARLLAHSVPRGDRRQLLPHLCAASSGRAVPPRI